MSTVIAFMIWLWLSFAMTLTGAELDAAIRRESDDGSNGARETLRSEGTAT
jgi:membrane protein